MLKGLIYPVCPEVYDNVKLLVDFNTCSKSTVSVQLRFILGGEQLLNYLVCALLHL